jgi:hypothetical protein
MIGSSFLIAYQKPHQTKRKRLVLTFATPRGNNVLGYENILGVDGSETVNWIMWVTKHVGGLQLRCEVGPGPDRSLVHFSEVPITRAMEFWIVQDAFFDRRRLYVIGCRTYLYKRWRSKKGDRESN